MFQPLQDPSFAAQPPLPPPVRATRASRRPAHIWEAPTKPKTELIAAASCGKAVPVEPSDCPVSMFDKEVYFMWGEGGTTSNYERPKTSVYVGKGLPAASRLDRLMNFFTELFVAA